MNTDNNIQAKQPEYLNTSMQAPVGFTPAVKSVNKPLDDVFTRYKAGEQVDLSIPAGFRALIVSPTGDGGHRTQTVAYGDSVLNVRTELKKHLSELPLSEEWLLDLRSYIDGKLTNLQKSRAQRAAMKRKGKAAIDSTLIAAHQSKPQVIDLMPMHVERSSTPPFQVLLSIEPGLVSEADIDSQQMALFDEVLEALERNRKLIEVARSQGMDTRPPSYMPFGYGTFSSYVDSCAYGFQFDPHQYTATELRLNWSRIVARLKADLSEQKAKVTT